MEARRMAVFCFLSVAASAVPAAQDVTLMSDQISLRIPVSKTATLKCCCGGPPNLNMTWTHTVMISNNSTVNPVKLDDKRVQVTKRGKEDVNCSSLVINDVSLNDIGLYRCNLQHESIHTELQTPGTFLQVFVPIKKTLNISESVKNSIITAEGVLLLLIVVIPGAMLLCKSKGLHELEKRKGKEEENIYEGLNLDDCTSTYHQIQRSQVQGPYQDVVNAAEDDIQLEKP
ncbi:B-cell antigen receptor complex-associated protein alpha chain [Salminus brasiliensis]|uniref:B-cell antigen receptor complex-associated protein alpha chain n=1 Tax=Salminus brasiliensis TaxID=930266 RepID=UPI003B839688